MSMLSRSRSSPIDVAARLAELQARVHPSPSSAPEVDVAALVRAEVERQRAADAEARRRADEARFEGGPCWACGATTAIAENEDGTRSPDWHTTARGQLDGWCLDWKSDGTDEELLDRVAAILVDEGLAGLSVSYRLGFRIERGLASRIGVIPWIESGQPPGHPWAHLQPVETALRARQEDEEARRTDLSHRTFGEFLNATAHHPAYEPGPGYGNVPDPVAARYMGVRLEFTDDDRAKLRTASEAQRERIYKRAADRVAKGERRR